METQPDTRTFRGHSYDNMAETLSTLVRDLFRFLPTDAQTKGSGIVCNLTFVPHEGDEVSFDFLVGSLEDDRQTRCTGNVAEKIARLRSHPDDVASWLSRNEELEQWGGAIKVETDEGIVYLSASAWPEHGDESLMLAWATHLHLINADGAYDIALQTGNEIWIKILQDGGSYRPDTWWTMVPEVTTEGNIILHARLLNEDGDPVSEGEPLWSSEPIRDLMDVVHMGGMAMRAIGFEEPDDDTMIEAVLEAVAIRTQRSFEELSAATLAARPRPEPAEVEPVDSEDASDENLVRA
jgi:hypothetical protein